MQEPEELVRGTISSIRVAQAVTAVNRAATQCIKVLSEYITPAVEKNLLGWAWQCQDSWYDDLHDL